MPLRFLPIRIGYLAVMICLYGGSPLERAVYSYSKNVGGPDMLKEAQEILVRCGALSYGVFQFQERADRVEDLLVELNVDLGEIRKLFDELITPAEDLVNAATN